MIATKWEGQYEQRKPKLARLATTSALDATKMSLLQFCEIQTSGVALSRWPAGHVCIAPSALHVLLASILLDNVADSANWMNYRSTALFAFLSTLTYTSSSARQERAMEVIGWSADVKTALTARLRNGLGVTKNLVKLRSYECSREEL